MSDESLFLLAGAPLAASPIATGAAPASPCGWSRLIDTLGGWLKSIGQHPVMPEALLVMHGELGGYEAYTAMQPWGAKGGES